MLTSSFLSFPLAMGPDLGDSLWGYIGIIWNYDNPTVLLTMIIEAEVQGISQSYWIY